MVDITKMVAPKTDQLNADDLLGGKTRDIKITKVKENDSETQPLSIYFEGDNNKPWKPCKGMRRVLIDLWGDDVCRNASVNFVGRAVRLYRDPDVTFGSTVMGGIRISHASHIDREQKILVTTARARRVEFLVRPLEIGQNHSDGGLQEKEKPAHVKTAAKILRAISECDTLESLTAYWEDKLTQQELQVVELAKAEAAEHVKKKYQERLTELQIPQ